MSAMGDDTDVRVAENTHHRRRSSSLSSSSSSDSDYSSAVVKHKIYRLFGREKPIHKVLGGGKRMCTYLCFLFTVWISHSVAPQMFWIYMNLKWLNGFMAAADVFLWREKKTSASVIGAATAIWFLFELVEYHLLTFICHIFILFLTLSFLWSNTSSFINKLVSVSSLVCMHIKH